MRTFSVTLELDQDGTVHLPLPPDLRNTRLRISGTFEPVEEASPEASSLQTLSMEELLERIRERNPFRDIKDPVAWQREVREDRELPFAD